LQDLAVGFGRDISRFNERKRSVPDENLGPLIATDMTRCIHCTRCVRFTEEIEGFQELGMIGRGEQMKVRTAIEKTVDHELSGNVVDLCPVGALVSKPFRFRARGWEMSSHPLVSPHDGVGTNLYGHVLRGRLMRVIPRENEAINETWIADRDRFSYEGIYSADRLGDPEVRQGRDWVNADWGGVLQSVAAQLRAKGRDVAVLVNPSSTLEELYLLNRITRALGSNNIDHRLRQTDFRDQNADPAFPSLGMSIADVEQLQSLLLIGANLRRDVPILAHRVRKAARAGATVAHLSPAESPYLFPVAGEIVAAPDDWVDELTSILAAMVLGTDLKVPQPLVESVRKADVRDRHRSSAAALLNGERRAVWLGALALRHPAYADLRALAAVIAGLAGAKLGVIAEGGNAAGAYLAGALPNRDAGGQLVDAPGLTAAEMLRKPQKAYVLFGGVEPWLEAVDGEVLKNLKAAELVVAITPFASDTLREIAHVLLPMGTFAETSGTYVNIEGKWQSAAGAAAPYEQARPGWKILRVLGNQLGLPGFEYQSSEEVRAEVAGKCEGVVAQPYAGQHHVNGGSPKGPLLDLNMYQVDAVVRRAPSLQRTREGRIPSATY
jgi:NADH-quinone oxidoreductase subunit G